MHVSVHNILRGFSSRSLSQSSDGWWAAGLVVLHLMLTAWCAARYSPTTDEPAHLAAGLAHWQFGRYEFYRVNPPLVRMWATAILPYFNPPPRMIWTGFYEEPGARPEFTMGQDFLSANGDEAGAWLRIARWCCLPLSAIGAVYVLVWSRELFGRRAGLLALALWTFSPNLIGHGALITPDRGAATFGVVAGYYFWKWMRQRTWISAVYAGLALGLPLLTKSSWLVLFLVWPAVWIFSLFQRRSRAVSKSLIADIGKPEGGNANAESSVKPLAACVTEGLQLGLVLFLGLYVVHFGYRFHGTGVRLGEFQFVSRMLTGNDRPSVGNRFCGTWVADLPVPLPRQYVIGIDLQRVEFEDLSNRSYLLGQWRETGWWYYYIVGAVVKWPIGLWLLIVLLGFETARGGRDLIGNVCVVLGPPIAIFLLASSQTGLNHHFRYVLPAEPFLFVACSSLLKDGRSSRWRSWLVNLSMTALIIESLCVFPNHLSFFNYACGGPSAGASLLLSSNIDWGQDVDELQQWIARNRYTHPIHVAVAGPVNPSSPLWQSTEGFPVDPEAVGGWYAISVNYVHGDHDRAPTGADERFLRYSPVARIGYSILIFHLPGPP